ncbi:peptidoglycan-binding protein [Oceanobacillus locisalsi]|uniref:Peptidoglycan-binding protein n=1 Tax=Oceanobacillus locisalsi TaxID=546107 RepID=A0ABW3NDE8_9BACI
MRKKWILLLAIALLIISPFSSVSETYAMSNNQHKEGQQSDNHIEEENNIIDIEQQDASPAEEALQLGDEDEIIQELKEDLTELGFASLKKPTEYFGLHTEESLKKFQAFYDKEVTGIADEDTLLTIDNILAEDSFEREEHIEFSKPEEFVTEEEESEESSESEGAENTEEESEESSESEGAENTEEESEESSESEGAENTEEESGESSESEGAENTEEESEESSESEGAENTEEESGESSESEGAENTEEESGESSESEGAENTEEESEESSESEGAENTEEESEESSESEGAENTEEESEESSESEGAENTEEESEESSESEGAENTEEESEESSESEGAENTEEESGESSESEGTENTEEESDESSGSESVFSVNGIYTKGDRDPEIAEIKEQFNAIGFGGITVTEYYGDYFEGKVEEFQEYYGLSVNGTLDQATKDQVDSVYNSPFQRGERHDDIPDIKEKLNSLGYSGISVTRLFGEYTEQKVEEFQRDHGLQVNGIVDEVTLAKLDEQVPYTKGNRSPEIAEIKEQFNAIGFGGITVTEYYGDYFEGKVEEFQEYYGLSVNGTLDQATRDQVDSVYNSPFQRGERHDDIPDIKEKLNSLGYSGISVTRLFGEYTEQKVEEFQRDHGLRVNGIVDEVTLAKLDEQVPYTKGDRSPEIAEIKEQFNAIGFGGITVTEYYGDYFEGKVEEFQEYYGLSVNGTLDQATRDQVDSVYNSPFQRGERHDDIPDIKEKLNSLGYSGISVTRLFGEYTEQKVEEFQRDHGLRVNGIVDEVTLSHLNQAYDELSTVKIFLDPGHGAHDPGGQGYGLNEKDVVLDIALETERILTSKYQGVEVEMSRRTDTFVELEERANHANSWGADYFISFHNNAFDGSTGGFESYIYNGNVSQETRDKQNDIHSYISSRINVSDRGQKSANLSVLRNTNMPAILIEYLFIDNFTENALLKSDNYKNQLAQYTADAIADSYDLERQ